MKVQFELMKKCNANCWYCIEHGQKDKDEQYVYNNFVEMFNFLENKKILNNNVIISLIGGEISIFSNDFLNKIFNKLKKYKKFIFTNGTKNEIFNKLEDVIFFEHIIDWKHKYICKKENTDYIYLPEPGDSKEIQEFYLLNNLYFDPIKIEGKYLKYSKQEFEFVKKTNYCLCKGLDIDCINRTIGRCREVSDFNKSKIPFENFFKFSKEEMKKFIEPVDEKCNMCQECRKYKISDLDSEIQNDILKNDYWLS